MHLSYWEKNTFFKHQEVTILGAGIVGLTTAIFLKKKHPTMDILVLEKGFLPSGASTKNAGFACFGSVGELLDDAKTLPIEEVIALLLKRKQGLEALQALIGSENMDFQQLGGYELFTKEERFAFQEALDFKNTLNLLLKNEFDGLVYQEVNNTFGFDTVSGIIKNSFEGQIDTGMLMKSLMQLTQELNICVYSGVEATNVLEQANGVKIELNNTIEIFTKQLVICTNGFAKQFLPQMDVQPARAQILITKPIPNLPLQGTFHYDKGYYYFRNIHNRILLGGGRNLAFKEEHTTTMANTAVIQNKLNHLLNTVILPNTAFEIDYAWSGIMGIGNTKQPIVKKVSSRMYCGIRLGGMGVALGTLVGKELAETIER